MLCEWDWVYFLWSDWRRIRKRTLNKKTHAHKQTQGHVSTVVIKSDKHTNKGTHARTHCVAAPGLLRKRIDGTLGPDGMNVCVSMCGCVYVDACVGVRTTSDAPSRSSSHKSRKLLMRNYTIVNLMFNSTSGVKSHILLCLSLFPSFCLSPSPSVCVAFFITATHKHKETEKLRKLSQRYSNLTKWRLD